MQTRRLQSPCGSRGPCFRVASRRGLKVRAAKNDPPLEYGASQPSKGHPHTSLMRDKDIHFTGCTVMFNEALNLEGSSRLLKLSIPDSPTILYGKKIQGVVGSERWIDSYTCPGQLVALKLPGRDVSKRLYSIASTPYESRSESSSLAASLIEVVAERAVGEDDEALSNLGPGAELEVSQVIGRGFSSVLGSGMGILGALESGQPLLVIGMGLRGMVPCRALLSWVPVQAHATRAKVSCLYLTPSPQDAAFIPEWDAVSQN
ncbi:hypothetical protein DUNSADRAFT_10576 [Dunaliella salina]|uniref:FAD-binding FR-type domain-containing protein n=1 Tax=Dunaliella salina TaxID=3046 RepID=A0ABQ7H4T1_DUNSA|nr:hypothetical protein DUNSADRAFT_10576 [Dunaliella salina]|eukprot:KAF5841870.1 hypothetical protein DUNSADRAFT_10576 [Dunaliella salina]